ncbi:hypothetical protein [Nitrosospira multiformis]|uniref:hypothetical protein n=1 Tax=Nitrosospira multiformis TaxID=1231 RepID=UPI00089C230D|nr:hypothetical protein [Nitrosospira multiformis]SEA17296.1 hypothetical protein SAMN05216411_105154 [Nitrosospira multiformis]
METYDLSSLSKASAVAQKALADLPETPVAAAGVNIRYALDPLPDAIMDLLKAPIDDVFSDEGFTIKGGVTKRLLDFPPGVVNVEITQGKEGEGYLLLNFHYDSTSPETLKEWLAKTEDFFAFTEKLLTVIEVPPTQEGE